MAEKLITVSIKECIRKCEEQIETFSANESAKLDSLKQQHQSNILQTKETVSSLNDKESSLNQLKQDQSKRVEAKCAQLKSFEQELAAMQEQLRQLPAQLQQVHKKQQDQKVSYEARAKDLDALRAESNFAKQEISRGSSFFSQRLGLDFNVMDGEIRMTMRYIDPSDHKREFSFRVLVDQNDQFQVYDCIPAIPNLDSLVKQLNTTNEFGRFTQAMRQSFRTLVKTGVASSPARSSSVSSSSSVLAPLPASSSSSTVMAFTTPSAQKSVSVFASERKMA